MTERERIPDDERFALLEQRIQQLTELVSKQHEMMTKMQQLCDDNFAELIDYSEQFAGEMRKQRISISELTRADTSPRSRRAERANIRSSSQ